MFRTRFTFISERPMFNRIREPKKIEIKQPFYRMMERGTFKRKKNPIRWEW